MAEEELVDPKKYLEESCKPKCVKPLLEYQKLMGFEGVINNEFNFGYIDDISCGHFSINASVLACTKRIQGDETGHKHCTGQYFDYWSCIDKCVAPKLFTKLK